MVTARGRNTCGLRRDHRLVPDAVQEEGLDELRFDQRGGRLDDRLVGEHELALGNRAHLAGEPQPGEHRQ